MADIDITKIRRLDFTLLLVMQALLRHRRTTLAAEQLGLSQSAISHALARLRALFGDPLFLRRPHGLEPTRHALDLAARIDALVRAANEAMGLPDRFDPATTTRGFRLGASDFLATLFAPPLLGAFEREAPRARFALRVALGAEALENLRRGEIDMALGRFQRPLEGYRAARLFEDRYCLVARNRHPALRGPISRAQFAKLDHVAVSVTGDFRAFTDEDFRDLGLRRRVSATVPRFSIAFGVVGQTDAVAVAPSRLARAYAKAYRLALHDLPAPLPPIRIVAVRRDEPDLGLDWLMGVLRAVIA
jgi:DNA-binding transcriptional LysR family regulator